MSKTVAEIEADLAAAKAAEAEASARKAAENKAAADRQRRLDAIDAEIAAEQGSIEHLQNKIMVRAANISALQARKAETEK